MYAYEIKRTWTPFWNNQQFFKVFWYLGEKWLKTNNSTMISTFNKKSAILAQLSTLCSKKLKLFKSV